MFALGLPAYILIKVLVTCFFAREDTKTPMYVSLVAVTANIILSLILIQSMREIGIALATAISAWINALILYIILNIRDNITLDSRLIRNGYKIIICTFVMGIICYFLNVTLLSNMALLSTILNFGALTLAVLINQVVYIAMIFMLKVLTIDEFKGYIKK